MTFSNKFFLEVTILILIVNLSSAYSVEFYHSDHLGSPSVITDESGGVVWSADYDTFGEAVNEQGENDIKYNSKEEDKTGLLYYGARYYNPETGRFITADTVKGDVLDSQSQNRYVYVKNNPLKYIDPTGNQEMYADRSKWTRAYDCTTLVRASYANSGEDYAPSEVDWLIKKLAKNEYVSPKMFVVMPGKHGEEISAAGFLEFSVSKLANSFVSIIDYSDDSFKDMNKYYEEFTSEAEFVMSWFKDSVLMDLAKSTTIIAYDSSLERAEAMRTILPGSPILNFYPSGDRFHAFLKAEGRNTLEAHINKGIGYDVDGLLNYNDPFYVGVATKNGESRIRGMFGWAMRQKNNPTVGSIYGAYGSKVYYSSHESESVSGYFNYD
ncbi:MAG: RHS domain-containing protein [Nanoarchaeota archaeon]|nr:RHS domain-containing protein [Nanoarchaeota archaeon]